VEASHNAVRDLCDAFEHDAHKEVHVDQLEAVAVDVLVSPTVLDFQDDVIGLKRSSYEHGQEKKREREEG